VYLAFYIPPSGFSDGRFVVVIESRAIHYNLGPLGMLWKPFYIEINRSYLYNPPAFTFSDRFGEVKVAFRNIEVVTQGHSFRFGRTGPTGPGRC